MLLFVFPSIRVIKKEKKFLNKKIQKIKIQPLYNNSCSVLLEKYRVNKDFICKLLIFSKKNSGLRIYAINSGIEPILIASKKPIKK